MLRALLCGVFVEIFIVRYFFNVSHVLLRTSIGSHFSEFLDLRIAQSSGYPGYGGLEGAPQLGRRERSSRYPG